MMENITFSSLKSGEAVVFEGKPYMKMHECQSDDGSVLNAVHVETGHPRHIAKGSKVILKAKAVIRLDG
jgi:hypothetical protein